MQDVLRVDEVVSVLRWGLRDLSRDLRYLGQRRLRSYMRQLLRRRRSMLRQRARTWRWRRNMLLLLLRRGCRRRRTAEILLLLGLLGLLLHRRTRRREYRGRWRSRGGLQSLERLLRWRWALVDVLVRRRDG